MIDTSGYVTMNMLDAKAVLSGLRTLIVMSLSSLQDTLTSRSHSRDFAVARGDYLRNRVLVVGIIFFVLLPFWTAFDWFLLPSASLRFTMPGRLVMLLVLTGTLLLAFHSQNRLEWARLAAGILIATPAAFYGLVLATLPPGQTELIGYSFIPYMLVTMLSIFPFTLIESVVAGAALIVLEMYSLHVSGTLFSAAGVQAVWLLAALLVIAMTANYFQLGLMLRLYREATHDPLTGLLNRGALLRAVEELASRDTTPRPALLMMDLDHFKRLNDTHGHAFGDDVLRRFASILKTTLRPSDLAARYGGEEFVAVLNATEKEAAMEIAERIRQQTEAQQLVNYEGQPVNFTVSIGVATLHPNETFQAAAMRADNRLYEAKRTSRNCVVGA